MKENRADIFTINIGNLPAHKQTTITITYLTELGLEGDDARFILPTTIAPRYTPALPPTSIFGDGHSTNNILNAPTSSFVPYTFSVNIDVQMPSSIVKVTSPTHPLNAELNGNQCRIHLSDSSIMDVDFVMTIAIEKPNESRVWIESSGK
jgi:Ca-activated chloride channel homolog